jgi:DNA-binding FadR family transcriptional regulator
MAMSLTGSRGGCDFMSDTLRGPSLVKRAQTYIRNYIVTHNLQPGDPLPPEGELANTLQVSRGSIREAIKALEALGVIEVQHGNGLFVRPFNLDAVLENLSYSIQFDRSTLGELSQIRKWLEVAVIGEVIHSINEGQLHELEQILADWEVETHSGTGQIADRRFHRALSSVVGNRMLTLFLDIFWEAFNYGAEQSIGGHPDPALPLAAHRRILEAVQARDAGAARQAILDSYVDLEERLGRAGQAPEHGR